MTAKVIRIILHAKHIFFPSGISIYPKSGSLHVKKKSKQNNFSPCLSLNGSIFGISASPDDWHER